MKIKESVGFQLIKILKLKRHFIDHEMKKLELSRTEWRVLLWMKILGHCSQKELLKNLEIDAAHLARLLERFEKNNVIVRKKVENDRRALFVELTPHCKKTIMPHLEKSLEEENKILLRGLSANDKKNLFILLNKLEKNMEDTLSKKPESSNIHET